MTGAGAPGGPGILKCLQKEKNFKVYTADADENAAGRFLNATFETIPPAFAPLFIESVMELCHKKNIQVILPLVTKELLPLARHKEEFEKRGIKIPISSPESIEIANNKARLYEFLQWRGVAVPAFQVVETVEQFTAAVTALGFPGQPVCFKPAESNGGRGFRIISNEINESDLLFTQKPNSLYISLKNAQRILSSAPFPELLVCEWLPGEEYSVDCLANNGEAVLVVPRRRDKTINGISIRGEFIKNEVIESYCREITRQLRLHGNIGIQLKAAANAEFLLLEINPRVQGTISACLGAGVNLPVLAVKQELGLPISQDELNVRWGTKFWRYWEEVFDNN